VKTSGRAVAAENSETPGSSSRRRMLRWLALAGLGGGLAVVGFVNLVGAPESAKTRSPESLIVKAVYFQMSQSVSVGQEYFGLEAPAHVSDLLKIATQRHPALSEMVHQMLILVEGVPAVSATVLADGDEVDLIPTLVGG